MMPISLTASLKIRNTVCKDSPDGNIDVTISGGIAPYTFIWNDNPSLNKQNISGVTAGKYKLLITDKNGCTSLLSAEVLPGNCKPVAVDDEFRSAEDTQINNSVALNDADPDKDKLIFTNTSNPQHGILIFKTDGSFNFKPDPSWSGTTTFNYTACDSAGLCSSATVTFIINPVNHHPVAVNDTYQTPIGVPLIVKQNAILSNDYDPDGDKISAILQSNPSHGGLLLNSDGTFTYTPDKTFQGEENFTYFANDGILNSNLARVTINIPGNSSTGIIATVNLTPARSQISEGDTATVTAELTNKLPDDVTITLSFSGTAENTNVNKFEGRDYHLSGNFSKIRIPAGQTKTTEKFSVEALPDDIKEGDEFVDAHISTVSSTNAIIGSNAIVVIKDIWPPIAVIKKLIFSSGYSRNILFIE